MLDMPENASGSSKMKDLSDLPPRTRREHARRATNPKGRSS
jgi:hypothetical protein